MKSILTLACFSVALQTGTAQSTRPEPLPITRDSALKFKTIQAVFGLPATDSIAGGTVAAISRRDNTTESWKPAKGFSDPIIVQMISQAKYGDRLVFEGFVVVNGDKKTKLEAKSFRVK